MSRGCNFDKLGEPSWTGREKCLPFLLLPRDSAVATFLVFDIIFFIKCRSGKRNPLSIRCFDVAPLSGGHFNSAEGGQVEQIFQPPPDVNDENRSITVFNHLCGN